MKKNILHNKSLKEFHADLLSGKTSIFEVTEEIIENYNYSEAGKSAFVEFNKISIENAANFTINATRAKLIATWNGFLNIDWSVKL